MLEQRPSSFAKMDRIIAELGSSKSDYFHDLATLEAAASQVLAEQGVSSDVVSFQALDDLDLSDRASKAMSALISIRLLRGWEMDALNSGPATSEAFYRVAHHAMTACLAGTLVSPMISGVEGQKARATTDRKKGGHARAQRFAIRNEEIKAVLLKLWRQGARYSNLGEWARAITAEAADLNFPGLERKISELGQSAFRDEWTAGRRKSS